MEKPLNQRTLWDNFSKIEAFLGNEPDEDRCQEALINLEKLSGRVKDRNDQSLTSSFQSYWMSLETKLKEHSDCKTYLDSKKEIDKQINLVLDPDMA